MRKIIEWFKNRAIHGIMVFGNGKVDILIDSNTPCLVNRHTGEIVETFYEKLELSDLKKIRKKDGWKFHWTEPYYNKHDVFALKTKGDNICQGLIAVKVIDDQKAVHIDIVENAPQNYSSEGLYNGVGAHLFAIAIKISMEVGCGGFVFFEAKTGLIEYYKEKLCAKQIGNSQRMVIEEPDALKILEIYFPGGENNA